MTRMGERTWDPRKPRGRNRPHPQHGGKRPWQRAPERRAARGADAPVILYGWHPVTAALANPARRIRKVFATENAARRLADEGIALETPPELVRGEAIAARLPADAVHQGLLVETEPLPSPELEELAAE